MLSREPSGVLRWASGCFDAHTERSRWSGAGIKYAARSASTVSAPTRSGASHSPAMYDSPKPISPWAPIRRKNAAGSRTSTSGPPRPSVSVAPSRTRRGSWPRVRRRIRSATAVRIRDERGARATSGQRCASTACAARSGAAVADGEDEDDADEDDEVIEDRLTSRPPGHGDGDGDARAARAGRAGCRADGSRRRRRRWTTGGAPRGAAGPGRWPGGARRARSR